MKVIVVGEWQLESMPSFPPFELKKQMRPDGKRK
jgi:hypothetical protein